MRCPLALADGASRRLTKRPGPVLLITTDLDDPLPAFRATKDGRKLGDQVVRWRALAELATADKQVRQAIKAAAKGVRRFLPTALALESPRLAPPLALLIDALPWLKQNKDNWTLRRGRELLLTMYAFNAGTHEGLQLRLTDEGLDRWPGLEPDERVFGKYAVSWTLKPEEVPEIVAALTTEPEA
jgi:hypothetical protein